ncbi:MAG: hypothetical protein WCJ87_07265 [Burkholderiales bacterium]
MAATLIQLRWQGAQWLRGVGLPGWVGLALGLACVIGLWSLIQPMHADAQQLDADSDLLAQRAAARALSKAASEATPQQQLAAFEQRFGGERTIAPTLARLQAAAQRRGFMLDQAEFKWASEPAEPLARYSIQLPIKADYRALRRFSRDALRDMPALALDEVSLRRSDPKSPLLDAQLRFVLFLAKPATSSANVAVVGSASVAAATAN